MGVALVFSNVFWLYFIFMFFSRLRHEDKVNIHNTYDFKLLSFLLFLSKFSGPEHPECNMNVYMVHIVSPLKMFSVICSSKKKSKGRWVWVRKNNESYRFPLMTTEKTSPSSDMSTSRGLNKLCVTCLDFHILSLSCCNHSLFFSTFFFRKWWDRCDG